jgi:hypothetical protein
MMNPICLEELARTRQRDILKEAEYQWKLSRAVGKKAEKKRIMGRIIMNVINLAAMPTNKTGESLTWGN